MRIIATAGRICKCEMRRIPMAASVTCGRRPGKDFLTFLSMGQARSRPLASSLKLDQTCCYREQNRLLEGLAVTVSRQFGAISRASRRTVISLSQN